MATIATTTQVERSVFSPVEICFGLDVRRETQKRPEFRHNFLFFNIFITFKTVFSFIPRWPWWCWRWRMLGRSSKLTTDGNEEKVKEIIMNDGRITIREVADDVGVSTRMLWNFFDFFGYETRSSKIFYKIVEF